MSFRTVMTLSAAACVVLLFAGLMFGAQRIDVIAALSGTDSTGQSILLGLRLPRLMLAALAGGALSVSGALMQTYFHNPLAEPYITGVSAGGALGAVLGLSLGLSGAAAIAVSSVAGSALVTAALLALASYTPAGSHVSVLLLGLAMGTFCGALIWLILLRQGPGGTDQVVAWLLGRVATVGMTEPLWLAGFAALGWLLSWRLVPQLDALLLGEEKASSVGVSLPAARRAVLGAAVLLSGACVAFCGVIAFVGLIVPHMARLAVGSAHRRLLPAAALLGSALTLLVDLVSRLADPPREIPLTIVTSIIGAPFFIFVLLRSRGSSL